MLKTGGLVPSVGFAETIGCCGMCKLCSANAGTQYNNNNNGRSNDNDNNDNANTDNSSYQYQEYVNTNTNVEGSTGIWTEASVDDDHEQLFQNNSQQMVAMKAGNENHNIRNKEKRDGVENFGSDDFNDDYKHLSMFHQFTPMMLQPFRYSSY